MDLFGREDLARPVKAFIQPATTLRAGDTVYDAVTELRDKPIDERTVYFYLVNAVGQLAGAVSPRKLLLADPGRRVDELVEQPVVSVRETATLEEAMEVFAMYRLLALPVVDQANCLLGQIDVSLYAEEAMDLGEAHRAADVFQLIGLSVAHRGHRRPWRSYRRRMPWLLCNVLGGIACALIGGLYRSLLERVVLIALFIPLVLTLGEAVAMQSMTLALPSLRGPKFRWRRLVWQILVEWRTALLLGLTCAALVAGAAVVWGQPGRPVAAIAASVLTAILLAGSVGTIMPGLLHRAHLTPEVAAGPVALMLTDILTTSVYLALAAWLV